MFANTILQPSFISTVRDLVLFKISALQHYQQKAIILAAQTEIANRAFISENGCSKLFEYETFFKGVKGKFQKNKGNENH